MKKFEDPIERGMDWLRGTDEGEKRWWLVLKAVLGVIGLILLVNAQLPTHLKLW